MKYLSLFSGIGGFELAINRVYPNAECLGYSEIDKFALKLYRHHYPNHKALGDIRNIDMNSLPKVDLIVGGFPCQDLSSAKANRKGLDGKQSGLFWVMVDILEHLKPRWFLFENVASMRIKDRDTITQTLGVEPIMIDAALVSAQRRRRLYWCNWDVFQPDDRSIFLPDILEDDPEVKSMTEGHRKWMGSESGIKRQKMSMVKIDPDKALPLMARTYANWGGTFITQRARGFNVGGNVSKDGKVPTITSSSWEHNNHLVKDGEMRKLSPVECERLQCFPDNYTDILSHTQRYRTLGNAVNVSVVEHILNQLRERIND